ncbi:hypothetical protein D3C87_1499610 [compost metagenome]
MKSSNLKQRKQNSLRKEKLILLQPHWKGKLRRFFVFMTAPLIRFHSWAQDLRILKRSAAMFVCLLSAVTPTFQFVMNHPMFLRLGVWRKLITLQMA